MDRKQGIPDKMAKLSPFTVVIIILYLLFIAWIYMLYTGSSRLRNEFQHDSLFQRPAPPAWLWMKMLDSTISGPQMMTNMTWHAAKDMDEAKKDQKSLRNTLDHPRTNIQQDLSNGSQTDSKDGVKIEFRLEKAKNGTNNKTAASSPLSTFGFALLENQAIKLNKRNSTTTQTHLVKKNDPRPIRTEGNSLEHQGHFSQRNDSGGLDGYLNKTRNQTQISAKSSIFSPSVKPRPRVQSQLTPIPVMFKKNFKKMPNWGTNDEYLRSHEPLQTVCSESLHRTKDAEFQKAFIPDIQLYLYQNLLNLSEWNRLARFNNPFGFMEYNFSEVKSAVDLIPRPNVTQLLPVPENDSCIRCAVVANGGILNGSKMGKEIDSHTYVFRMNGAVMEGHEEDVGNRTSVYVHTAFSLVASLIRFGKYGFRNIPHDEGIKYVMIPEGLRDFHFLQGLLSRQEVTKGEFRKRKPWTYYAGQFDESMFYVLHPDFLRYIRNRFMASKQQNGTHWALYRPTNGAFTLFLALHVCDIVDAYGFITENHRNYPNYYFDKQKTKVIFFINHDFNLEIKLWKKLHNAKIIRLYQREEGQG